MKVAVFVDHEIGYRLLAELLSRPVAKQVEILAVVTTRDNGRQWWPAVEPLAKSRGIPLLRYPRDRRKLSAFKAADYFFLFSWKHLLPDAVLAIPQSGTVNLHYSLLPKYRGVYPVNWALIEGAQETGISFHWVNDKIDAGETILQRRLVIRAKDTARTLQLRLDELAIDALKPVLKSLARMSPRKPKGKGPRPRGSYYSRAKFERCDEIPLERRYRARDLINLLRGKTFLPHGRNAYIRDEVSGRKIYLSLVLDDAG